MTSERSKTIILNTCRDICAKSTNPETKESIAAYLLALDEYNRLSFVHVGLKFRKNVKESLEQMFTAAAVPLVEHKRTLTAYLKEPASGIHQKLIYKLERKAKEKPKGHLAEILMKHTSFNIENPAPIKKTSIKRKASDRLSVMMEGGIVRKKSAGNHDDPMVRKSSNKTAQEIEEIWTSINLNSTTSESLHSSPVSSPVKTPKKKLFKETRSDSSSTLPRFVLHSPQRRKLKITDETSRSDSSNSLKRGVHHLFHPTANRSNSQNTLVREHRSPRSPRKTLEPGG